ncbi:hypothetical protein KsCSTR_49380 [Candidatus Kuenenia stuttgartiensis]|uniref:Uncharacterized protein n=1 Tax=Kuenenia stuttgartiensis TaxID=174633 RepID=A0A6G7GXR6_KUEST|nr:hypothetical protein KsCSTR_49380 [Candidatus Kuenenia stuttgartiensis]
MKTTSVGCFYLKQCRFKRKEKYINVDTMNCFMLGFEKILRSYFRQF